MSGIAVEHTGAESLGQLEALASYFERAYRQEIDNVRRYGRDLDEARRLYRKWHDYREAINARDRIEWDFSLDQVLAAQVPAKAA